MIYYPLSTLMLAGICQVLIITTPHEQAAFGSCWGMKPLGDHDRVRFSPLPMAWPKRF